MGYLRKALILGAVCLLASTAMADWVPADGHKMHFPQYPNEYGWNVFATNGGLLADDWECSQTGPVTDIHFWGSWIGGDAGLLNGFTLTIYEDIPADPQDPTSYSMPGQVLWGPVYISDFVAVEIIPDPQAWEGWYNPFDGTMAPYDHDRFYQYNITNIPTPFVQSEGTIYWLAITADVEAGPTLYEWGWKSSYMHFNDDAVADIAGWEELYVPDLGPIVNGFMVALDEFGNVVDGFGEYSYNNEWYYYTDDVDPWWNIWFYDHPYSPERFKEMYLNGTVRPLTMGIGGGYATIVLNWSTPAWSLEGNPPGEPRRPPLPADVAGAPFGTFLQRSQVLFDGPVPDIGIPLTDLGWSIPDYNPEWVSIDIRGENVVLDGILQHACIAQVGVGPQSLDLSFVINGPAELTGACCYPDGSCASGVTAPDCIAAGGDYGGDGTSCAGADVDGNGVDDFCDGVITLGACCYGPPAMPWTCINTTLSICGQTFGGNFYASEDCATFTCPENTGACCYDDGTCVDDMTDADCVSSGGDYGGDGSTCAGVDNNGNGVDDFCDGVVDLGACCYGDPLSPSCATTTATICAQHYTGTWVSGTDCATYDCPVEGACCLDDGATCASMTAADCASAGGEYKGDGSACLGDNNGNGIDDICETAETMKWEQPPDLTPDGMDVLATEYVILADDFECTATGPITKVEVWGSWFDDIIPADPGNVVFDLSFHRDIPATSTVSFPAPCPYVSLDPHFQIIEGLPPGTEVVIESFFDVFVQIDVQGGGSLGGSVVTFDATKYMTLTGTGDLAGYTRTMQMPVSFEVHTAPNGEIGQPLQIYSAIIYDLHGSLSPADPDFDLLDLRAGELYGLPCPGEVRLTKLGDGDFQVDSFFDITYEIDFIGAPGGALDGMSGSTRGTTRVDQQATGTGGQCTVPDEGEHSMPGEELCVTTFQPGTYAWEPLDVPGLEEGWYDPVEEIYIFPGDHNCFKYTFLIEDPCWFQEGTPVAPLVYWLDVQAFPIDGGPYRFGWKTSTEHWNDDGTWALGTHDGTPLDWNELLLTTGYPYIPGDCDGDGDVDADDITALQANLFGGAPLAYAVPGTVPPFYPAGDVDGNCTLNMVDLTMLTDYVNTGAPLPDYCPLYPPEVSKSLDLAFAIYTEVGSTTCCIGEQRGDANLSGGMPDLPTIGDISAMVDAKFISSTCGVKPGETEPVIACLDEADVNASAPGETTCGDITIGDISLLVDYLFITGPMAWDASKGDEFNGYFITGEGKLRPCP